MKPTEILLSVLFPVLVALGFGLAVTDATSGEFLFAKICICGAALAIITAIIYSIFSARINQTILKSFVIGFTVIFLMPALYYSIHWMTSREAIVSSQLFPSDQQTPNIPDGCYPPANALLVFLGSNVAWATQMPHRIFVVGGKESLTIDRKENSNEIVISVLRLFDDRKDIIARIDSNKSWIRNDIRKIYNGSSLKIYDHNDDEVLNIEFLNPKALRVTGSFRNPRNSSEIIVGTDFVQAAGMKASNSCFKENYVDVNVN